MLGFVITMLLALTWLGYETDWLRVRLLVGDLPRVELRKSWPELTIPWRSQPFWLRNPGAMAPLCGWDWLYNTMHIIPECKIEMEFGGVKHSMTVRDVTVIKDVVKAMKTKPHPYKHKATVRRNKLGGLVVALPAN